jgi:16S rRNA (adenine1518-N6/adenine1519-N6)-dimethyltransferase
MHEHPIYTQTRTKQLLATYGLRAKKSLGQHFMIDGNVLRAMVAAVPPEAVVIEIGPGLGALTEQLAQRVHAVVAVEIDVHMVRVLQDVLAPYAHVHIVHADVLRIQWQQLYTEMIAPYGAERPVYVVANLPYYVTTPIVLAVLRDAVFVRTAIVMMQEEVCARMTASPCTKAYGSLSIAIAYYAHAHMMRTIPATAFYPPPHVQSAVMRLDRRDIPPVMVHDEQVLFALVRAAFAHRRKTLSNNIASLLPDRDAKAVCAEWLRAAGIDGQRRGETLDIAQFAALANHAPAVLRTDGAMI